MKSCDTKGSGITAIYIGNKVYTQLTECIICKEQTEWESHHTVCKSCKREIKLNEVLGIENKPFREPYIFEEFKKDKNSHIPSNIQNRLKRKR